MTVLHLEHRSTVRLHATYVTEKRRAAVRDHHQPRPRLQCRHRTPAHHRRDEPGKLYVICTRARERTVPRMVTHELLAYDPDDRLDRVRGAAHQYAARGVLENILAREGNEPSATDSSGSDASRFNAGTGRRSIRSRHPEDHGT